MEPYEALEKDKGLTRETSMAEGQGNYISSNPIFTATNRRAKAAQCFEVCSMPSGIQREVEVPGMRPYSLSVWHHIHKNDQPPHDPGEYTPA